MPPDIKSYEMFYLNGIRRVDNPQSCKVMTAQEPLRVYHSQWLPFGPGRFSYDQGGAAEDYMRNTAQREK